MPRLLCWFFALGALLASVAHAAQPGWDLEKDVDAPSYAVAEPASTDVNIDSIVLSCERGPARTGLQLRLYLAGTGPLAPYPAGVPAGMLKDRPTFEFFVDGVRHAAQLVFAGEFVIVADAADGSLPLLSDRLIVALQNGRRMEMRFDLVEEAAGQAPAFDGTTVLNLQAGRGGSAVAAVRRCAEGRGPLTANLH